MPTSVIADVEKATDVIQVHLTDAIATPHQVKEALRRREAGEASREIARGYNVHHSTMLRL